ncbi:MAG: hypothetical protein FJ206_16995 [Gemmatimonadetes bacterium]|nr:hypothetical protein [Gemmatimonadota bacterium]
MWFRTCLLSVAIVAAPRPSSAQNTPSETASRFLEAWNARRWSQAAALLDLDQFDRFRQDFIARSRQAGGRRPTMTVEELRRMDPDMPREAAEYQVRRMEEEARRYADPTPFEFARVSSASALRALSTAEAAARWLESRDPQWQVRMQFEQAGCPPPDDLDGVPLPSRRLVGVVEDRRETVYAVYQEERAADDTPAWAGGDVFVMQLRLVRGRWTVQPRADLVPEVGQVDVSSCRSR